MPPRNAGRSCSSIFHTFLYLHITWRHKPSKFKHYHIWDSQQTNSTWHWPQSPAKSKETPHRRRARSLSSMSLSDLQDPKLMWSSLCCSWVKTLQRLKSPPSVASRVGAPLSGAKFNWLDVIIHLNVASTKIRLNYLDVRVSSGLFQFATVRRSFKKTQPVTATRSDSQD